MIKIPIGTETPRSEFIPNDSVPERWILSDEFITVYLAETAGSGSVGAGVKMSVSCSSAPHVPRPEARMVQPLRIPF